jgi:hypothetical protein
MKITVESSYWNLQMEPGVMLGVKMATLMPRTNRHLSHDLLRFAHHRIDGLGRAALFGRMGVARILADIGSFAMAEMPREAAIILILAAHRFVSMLEVPTEARCAYRHLQRGY